MDFIKYGHDTNRSLVKEGWTFYDTYSTQYRAEVKAKQLNRMGKNTTVTDTGHSYTVWVKD